MGTVGSKLALFYGCIPSVSAVHAKSKQTTPHVIYGLRLFYHHDANFILFE
jgi:hypothetical protein